MDAAQQYVRYKNTLTLGNVHTVIILGDPGAERSEKSSSSRPPDKLPPGLQRSVLIYQPENDRKLHFINKRRPRRQENCPGHFYRENTVRQLSSGSCRNGKKEKMSFSCTGYLVSGPGKRKTKTLPQPKCHLFLKRTLSPLL